LRIEQRRRLLVAVRVAAGDVTGGEQDGIVDSRRFRGGETEGGSPDQRDEQRSRERGELADWSTPGQSSPFCRPTRVKP
jgi:hypothetical protein